jgi:CCR4-NOT transcription complex subunit 6
MEKYIPFNDDFFSLFNYQPFSSAGFEHGVGLKDAYKDQDVEYTNYTPMFKGVIDYIFYNDKMSLCSVLSCIDDGYSSRIVGLPSVHLPSDHILIGARFVLKGGKSKKKEIKGGN